MCSCRVSIPPYLSGRTKPGDICDRCGASLDPTTDVFYRCEACGRENDARKTYFACAEEKRPECEWCAEHLCQFYAGRVEEE